jgi:hypothetical protein
MEEEGKEKGRSSEPLRKLTDPPTGITWWARASRQLRTISLSFYLSF